MASIHGFSIKNRKTFMGRDWQGDQGDICYEGKKVGWYNNDGNGGQADIDFYQAGEKRNEYDQLLKEAVKKYYGQHPITGQFADLMPDAELFMGDLLNLMDTEKSYKSLAKKEYPIVIIYPDKNGYEETIVGFKTIDAAEKYKAEKGITDSTIYSSLTDFIIT